MSGGLITSVPAGKALQLLDRLHLVGVKEAAIIGEIVNSPEGKTIVKSAS